MQLKKSIVSAGQTDNASIGEPSSMYTTEEIPDSPLNARMVQNVLLVWLDQNIKENNADCQDTIGQLRYIVNHINKFTDGEDCIQFLEDINDEKVCLIISGSFGQQIVPRIHSMSQVDTIFIFCSDEEYHEQWTKEWSKIKGVFTEILSMCEALKEAVQECEQNAISISTMATGDGLNKDLDQLEPAFMYIQIMKEILLAIDFESKQIQQYIAYCRTVFAENNRELGNIKKFQRKYCEETPIWWYTFECFLYPMVNRALRLLDIDTIIKMGFFIKDLHQHIEELHREQIISAHTPEKFTVYRGQGMSKTEFEQLRTNKGGLISFNNFLSTSKNRTVSHRFANRALTNPDLVGVLFTMEIDPSQSTTPFASIKDVSYFKGEDEVLFAMQTVFRIDNITSLDGNPRLFQVELTLTSDNDQDLCQLTDYIRQETFPNEEGWYRLGSVLCKMGEFDKSIEVYRILLEQTVDESKIGAIYHLMGWIKYKQGEYQESIAYNEEAIELYNNNRPLNNLNLAGSYNNVGMVYRSMGDYSEALLYYEKSLEIQQQVLPPNHVDLTSSYSNIGAVYYSIGDYSKALLYYQKSLEIQQQSPSLNYSVLAKTYIALGLVYDAMNEYSNSIKFYEKAIEIQHQFLPPNHPDLAISYNNIGVMYKNIGEYAKALSSHEKSLEIWQQSLPSNHPDLANSYANIGVMHYDMGDYSKALSYYEKSLQIQQQSLGCNHPDLATSYNNIGVVYDDLGEHSTALSYYEKSLEIRVTVLSPDHIDLAQSYSNISTVYDNMDEYSKALFYYQKLLEIQQQSLPQNHHDLTITYNKIAKVYYNMGENSEALLYYEKSLDIIRQSLSSDQSDLASSYNNVGSLYAQMGEYEKALPYLKKSLEIRQRSLPSNDPDLAVSYGNLGLLYEKMSDYSKAHSFYKCAANTEQLS